MSDDDAKLNEAELTFEGCYGSKVGGEELDDFLEDVFYMNTLADESGGKRFATCIWGHAGIGKTDKVKQFCNQPVTWRGQEYPGYKVYDVPVAQFEEMGDLHGMPERHVKVVKDEDETWVAESLMEEYSNDGWKVDHLAGSRTMYARPDWAPSKPGPAILLLDDFNRASVRIIKGIMQLLQNYAMVSWELPDGCNIVLTGNPDDQDYLVTSLDSAILTRIRHITLKQDAKLWAVWAQAAGLDSRGINFVLRYPEMMIGPERTNPRTLSEFFLWLNRMPEIKTKAQQRRFSIHAHSLLDDDTISSLTTFFDRDVEMIVEPEEILEGDDKALKHIADLMTRREKRVDIVGVICDRLFAYIVQPDTDPTDRYVENFQKFATLDALPEDMRYTLCLRLARVRGDTNRMSKWMMHNQQLKKMIMGVV